MTDEPDGVYDWPHAVGTESKAELLAEIARLRESRDTAADVLLEIAGIVDIKAGSIPKAVQDLKDESARLRGLLEAARNRPKIVCLCGSTRFYEYFQRANYEETMAGRIVLSVGFYPHAQKQMHSEDIGCTPEQKITLDELHKRKIDLADEVLVLNVGGYIGESTRSEIDHAITIGKPIRYLEAWAAYDLEYWVDRGKKAESRLSTVVEMLREWEPYIEFYAEREMNSPSNNQEAVIEVRDLLRRFRAILRDFPPEPKP